MTGRGKQRHHSAPGNDRVPCPTCRALTTWRDNPQRPFCSLTCRLIDLGRWLDERHGIGVRHDDDHSEPDVP